MLVVVLYRLHIVPLLDLIPALSTAKFPSKISKYCPVAVLTFWSHHSLSSGETAEIV